MNQYKTKTVIVGAGVIAKTHVRTLLNNEQTRFAAIADINEERAETVAGKSGARIYTDYKQMIRQERPDIAIITLPHDLHLESSLFCIEHGCHILLEKPMGLTALECEEINEAADRQGVTVSVGHMQHFYAAHAKAREMIASGELGQLVSILDKRHYPYFLPERPRWFLDKARSGGGILINLGSHSIDRIQWMTGSRIARVRAALTEYAPVGDVEGAATLFLQTASGVSATVSLCGYDNLHVNETILMFTGGQLKVTGSNQLHIASFKRDYEPIDLGKASDAFQLQWKCVLERVREGREHMGISGRYGQTVCAVVDAAYRSHATGEEQVVKEVTAATLPARS